MILAIDPGNVQSAYVVLDEDLKPVDFGKIYNNNLLASIYNGDFNDCKHFVIEKIASYGMAVGATVFDTCVYIGRLHEAILNNYGQESNYIYRKDEKMNLCHTMKAKDSNIRQALIDRFGVVGTKNNQGFFYGFKADIWAAMAVGVTFHDMHLKGDK